MSGDCKTIIVNRGLTYVIHTWAVLKGDNISFAFERHLFDLTIRTILIWENILTSFNIISPGRYQAFDLIISLKVMFLGVIVIENTFCKL